MHTRQSLDWWLVGTYLILVFIGLINGQKWQFSGNGSDIVIMLKCESRTFK